MDDFLGPCFPGEYSALQEKNPNVETKTLSAVVGHPPCSCVVG